MTPTTSRRRRVMGGAAALAIVVAALAVSVVTVQYRKRHHQPETPSASATSQPVRPGGLPVGIAFGGTLTGRTRAQVDTALDDVVALRMGWIRVDLSWASLQPASSSAFDWAATDPIIASARAHKLRVLGLLTYTPGWARASGCASFVCPPRRTSQFAAFAAAVVARYAPMGVTTYQVWNEPNITAFWRDPDPKSYGALLRATVTAMRNERSGLRVLFGGLAQAPSSDGNIEPGLFLRQSCARGCPVDAVGYDPYTYPARPGSTSRPLNAWQLMTNPTAATYGVRGALPRGLKIWVTQYGAPTKYDGGDDPRLVSEARQAQIVVDGLTLARRSPAIVGGYFVNTWRDSSAAGATRDHFGLVRADGTHKAAFAALQKALAG